MAVLGCPVLSSGVPQMPYLPLAGTTWWGHCTLPAAGVVPDGPDPWAGAPVPQLRAAGSSQLTPSRGCPWLMPAGIDITW